MNYALRGEDSLLDQKLVENTCTRLGVLCRVVNAEPRSGGNLQAWARGIRLEAMRGMRRKGEADFFFLGHHQGDVLETLFMKLAQGTSPVSFASLSLRSGRMIRPLLPLLKKEIVEALDEKGIPYRIDRSNLENDYLRNKIRNLFFPELDQRMPEWRESFSSSVLHWSEAARFLKRLALHSPWISRLGKRAFFVREKFHALPSEEARFLLQSALRTYFPKNRFSKNVYASIHQKVRAGKSGFLFQYGKAHVVFDHGIVGVLKQAEAFCLEIRLGETTPVNRSLSLRWEQAGPSDKGIHSGEAFYFSLPAVPRTLRLRSRKSGDSFLPHGLPENSAPVKLKDWFISHHVPRFLRDRAWVIEADAEIVGVVIDRPKLLARLQRLGAKTPSAGMWISRNCLSEKNPFRFRIFTAEKPAVG